MDDAAISDLIWRGEFHDAEVACGNGKSRDFRHAFRYAEVAFWKSVMTGDKNTAHLALTRLETAELVVENSRHAAKTANDRYIWDAVHAQVGFYRAMTQMSLFMYIKGAFAFRSSWKSYQSLPSGTNRGTGKHQHESLPPYVVYARRFGTGFFLYFMSMIPTSFNFLLRMIGFEADRDQGLKLLEQCSSAPDAPPCFARFSTLVLAMDFLLKASNEVDNTHIEALEHAEKLLGEQLDREPDLVLFQWALSIAKRRARKVDEAHQLLEQMVVQTKSWENPTTGCVAYRLWFDFGTLAVVRGDHAMAVTELERIVREGSGFTQKAMCYTVLAAVYGADGDLKNAMRCFEKVPSVCEGSRMEKQLVAKARVLKRRTRQHLAVHEIGYIFQHFKYMSEDRLHKILEQLEETIAVISNEMHKPGTDHLLLQDELATCLLLKGSALAALHKTEEAAAVLQSAITTGAAGRKLAHSLSRSRDYDAYHEPFAHYELAMCLAKSAGGDKKLRATAKNHLSLAAGFKQDYTFHHSLEWRVKMARRHLGE